MPKISVILTSRNQSKYIAEAIDSVLSQTYQDFELIILDDSSSDNSWDVIKRYTDPRIKAIQVEVQRAIQYGANKVISEIASGEYIAIHHSDDGWERDKLEKQVQILDDRPGVGAVFTWVQLIDEHGSAIPGNWFNQETATRWILLNQLFHEENHLNHPSVLIRRKCYQDAGLFRYGLAQTGDAEIWSRVLLKYDVQVVQEKLTRHRKYSDESGTSGYRIDAVVRAKNEWNMLRKNYLSITSYDDIVAIFPNLERLSNGKGFDTKFLLAMACLYECRERSAWQLGLSWLYELINDVEASKRIENIYSFSQVDLIRLSSEFDVYAVRELAKLDRELNAYHRSICFKLSAPLRTLKRTLFQ